MTETPMAARPKQIVSQGDTVLEPAADSIKAAQEFQKRKDHIMTMKRGPGRPPKPETADPFTVMTLIASALRTVDKPVRRQILETLLAVSD